MVNVSHIHNKEQVCLSGVCRMSLINWPYIRSIKECPLRACVCVCLQEMTRAARRTDRRTPTGTSGSRSHARSASVTTARSSATRSAAIS